MMNFLYKVKSHMKIKMNMKKSDVLGALGAILALGTVYAGITFYSEWVKAYEVIEPWPGAKCVVVSSIFNNSVSCLRISPCSIEGPNSVDARIAECPVG